MNNFRFYKVTILYFFNNVIITYNYVNNVILKAESKMKEIGSKGGSGYFTEGFQRTGMSFQYLVSDACTSP